MSIKFNGALISLSIANYQPTDFSKVTAHPEFVLKGKTFHDETGQLKEGTAALSGTGVDTSDATATETDVMVGATFYAGGEKKTGTHKCEAPNLEEITITENGEYIPSGDGYSKVTVSVEAEDSAIPTEVSTEAEMTALLTSGEVGGVYKYTGTTGTYENGALYVLEEEAVAEDELVGTWLFNDSISIMDKYWFAVNFECNGVTYRAISNRVNESGTASNDYLKYFTASSSTNVYQGAWLNEAYKTINITSKSDEVIEEFITWLKANAVKQ